MRGQFIAREFGVLNIALQNIKQHEIIQLLTHVLETAAFFNVTKQPAAGDLRRLDPISQRAHRTRELVTAIIDVQNPRRAGSFRPRWATKMPLAQRPNLTSIIGWAFKFRASRTNFLHALR